MTARLLAIFLLIHLVGCVDLTMQPFNPKNDAIVEQKGKKPQQASAEKRPHVYAIRGLFGIFSKGMDSLARRAKTEHPYAATSLPHTDHQRLAKHIIDQHRQHKNEGAIVLVGHSLGADDSIKVAKALEEENIPVDLLVTLDAVTPQAIPGNVKKVVNIYVPHVLDSAPVLRGIPVHAANPDKTIVQNIDVFKSNLPIDKGHINHMNVDEIPGIQNYVLSTISESVGS